MESPHTKTLQTVRLLATVSHLNRPSLEAHCTYSTRHEDMSPNGLYSFARPVAHADEVLAWRMTESGWVFQPRDFKTAGPEDWSFVVGMFKQMYSDGAVYNRVVSLRKHVRYLYEVDDLEKSEELGRKLGKKMEDALYLQRPEAEVVGVVIPNADLDAMVRHIRPRNSWSPTFPMEVRDRACLRVLRASGFRVSEHVSVRLWGCQREVHEVQATTGIHDELVCQTCGGPGDPSASQVPVYRLALPNGAADLKTGARTIFIQDPKAIEALDAWLAIHPARNDPMAPLWVAGETVGIRQLAPENVRRLVTKAVAWAKKAGHRFLVGTAAKLTPHDFRHSCATEKARLGWNEYQMCQYFGWRIGSPTPRVYVHLSLDDQRTLVLRAAVVVPTVAPAAGGAQAALANAVGLLQQAVALMGQPQATAATGGA